MALLVGAMLAGCAGNDEPTDASSDSAGAGTTAVAPSDGATTGAVDCGAIEGVKDTFGFGVQTLAQLQTQDQYNLVKDGTLAFDVDEFDAALQALAPLAAIETPLGSVTESLDFYAEANSLARENLAVDDPFAEAKGDDLLALNEDIGAFLGHQAPINYAVTEAGC
jgi:hypothetical protein